MEVGYGFLVLITYYFSVYLKKGIVLYIKKVNFEIIVVEPNVIPEKI